MTPKPPADPDSPVDYDLWVEGIVESFSELTVTFEYEEPDTKRLSKMRSNPQGDWRIEDVIAVCHEYDIACTKPNGGSHFKVSHRSQEKILTVPFKRPIKSVYIKKLVDFIDAVRSSK